MTDRQYVLRVFQLHSQITCQYMFTCLFVRFAVIYWSYRQTCLLNRRSDSDWVSIFAITIQIYTVIYKLIQV